jgi:hypothetical protein
MSAAQRLFGRFFSVLKCAFDIHYAESWQPLVDKPTRCYDKWDFGMGDGWGGDKSAIMVGLQDRFGGLLLFYIRCHLFILDILQTHNVQFYMSICPYGDMHL